MRPPAQALPSSVENYSALMDMFTKIRSNDFLDRADLNYFRKVLALFDNPENNMGKIIHVTGTNGKGSVTWKVARSIEDLPSNPKVGLYVSPNIYEFEERITINGLPIFQDDMVSYTNRILEKLHPKTLDTEENHDDFRIGMVGILACIAFLYFRDKKVDYAVIEGGIGAKRDHTNVVTPIISVITSIALDHVPMLGNNVEEIAEDKAHIIKTGAPIVIGPRVVFAGQALSRIIAHAELMKLEKNQIIVTPCPEETVFELDNQATAREVLCTLFGSEFQPTRAFYTSPPGRYQKVYYRVEGKPITCIFDVGHNADGFQATFSRCVTDFPDSKFILICGIAGTKDIPAVCEEINKLPRLAEVLLYCDNFRLEKTEKIADFLRKDLSVQHYDRITSLEAYLAAIKNQSNDKFCVVVNGSFYTVKGISTAMDLNLFSIKNDQLSRGRIQMAETDISSTLWDSVKEESKDPAFSVQDLEYPNPDPSSRK